MTSSISAHEEQLHSLLGSLPQRRNPGNSSSMFLRTNVPGNVALQQRTFVCRCTPTNILTVAYIIVLYIFLNSSENDAKAVEIKSETLNTTKSGSSLDDDDLDKTPSLLLLLMPSLVFILMSLFILRRIHALREMETAYLQELERMSDEEGGLGFGDPRSSRLPFLTPLALSAALERGDFPLAFGNNPQLANRLRLMLLNRDFGAEDFEALLQLEQGGRPQARSTGLSSQVIEGLIPTKIISAMDLEDVEQCFNQECPICLDNFAVGDTVRTLSCLHRMHASCIDPWLKEQSASCPVCKKAVAVGDNGAPGNDGGTVVDLRQLT